MGGLGSPAADHVASATGGRKESCQEASTLFHCSSAPGDPWVPVGVNFCSKLGPQSQLLVENSTGESDPMDRI
jgi:Werner syndrome ATP-dependent helicase